MGGGGLWGPLNLQGILPSAALSWNTLLKSYVFSSSNVQISLSTKGQV